jgi:hypothetical protein
MGAFDILKGLSWSILLSFVLQMLVLTAVARGILAAQTRLLWGSWRQRLDFIIVAHAIALVMFAGMTRFLEVGAAPPGFVAALLHSLSVLWPLQLALLLVDLAIRAGLGAIRRRS